MKFCKCVDKNQGVAFLAYYAAFYVFRRNVKFKREVRLHEVLEIVRLMSKGFYYYNGRY